MRLHGIQPAKCDQGETAENGQADGHAPGAHAQAASTVQQVFDRAQGAEPAKPGSKPQQNASEQTDKRRKMRITEVVCCKGGYHVSQLSLQNNS